MLYFYLLNWAALEIGDFIRWGWHGVGVEVQALPEPLHSTRDQPSLWSCHLPILTGVGPGAQSQEMPGTWGAACMSLWMDNKGTIPGNREIHHLKGIPCPV